MSEKTRYRTRSQTAAKIAEEHTKTVEIEISRNENSNWIR